MKSLKQHGADEFTLIGMFTYPNTHLLCIYGAPITYQALNLVDRTKTGKPVFRAQTTGNSVWPLGVLCF